MIDWQCWGGINSPSTHPWAKRCRWWQLEGMKHLNMMSSNGYGWYPTTPTINLLSFLAHVPLLQILGNRSCLGWCHDICHIYRAHDLVNWCPLSEEIPTLWLQSPQSRMQMPGLPCSWDTGLRFRLCQSGTWRWHCVLKVCNVRDRPSRIFLVPGERSGRNKNKW